MSRAYSRPGSGTSTCASAAKAAAAQSSSSSSVQCTRTRKSSLSTSTLTEAGLMRFLLSRAYESSIFTRSFNIVVSPSVAKDSSTEPTRTLTTSAL